MIVLLLAALSSVSLYARENEKKLCYKISYYGNNLWNPGFNAGLEYPYSTKEITDRKERTDILQSAVSVDLAFYADPGSHAAILLHSGLKLKKITENALALYIGFSPLGIYRSFLPETYDVSDEWAVTRVNLPGRTYYAPNISFGIENRLSRPHLDACFLEMEATTLVPYNTYAMFLLNIKLGVRL